LALYYLDTSALVKLYVREPGPEQVLSLASGPAGNQLAVLALAQVEIRSALRRRERAGEIAGTVVIQLLERLQRHLEAVFLRQVTTDATFEVAGERVDAWIVRTRGSPISRVPGLENVFGFHPCDLRLCRSAVVGGSGSGAGTGVRSVLCKKLGAPAI